MSKKPRNERFSRILFIASAAFLLFGYGVAVGEFRIFPYRVLAMARDGFTELGTQVMARGPVRMRAMVEHAWYYEEVENPGPLPPSPTKEAHPGLNLVTRIGPGLELSASIIAMNGRVVQSWDTDWFRIWPDAAHLPKRLVPKSRPGTHVHGAVVLSDGDLVFNFEHLGLVRLDRAGEVVWRLPYRTHHSVHLQDGGNLWVCGQELRTEPDSRFPHRPVPFDEYTLLEVSPEGGIVEKWSVPGLLHENGMDGILHLSAAAPHPSVLNDVLHLNDVEPFPASMEEDFFEHGDVLVSLRNVNTVFVFNRDTRRIKFSCTGWFVAQHDPDFVDGNTFSVFDNNHVPNQHPARSRIVMVSARERTTEVFFEGSPSMPFHTSIMGKHQWLPNGNLLVTESCRGRAFELTPEKKIAWEYHNYVDERTVGVVEQVERLPSGYGGYAASR